MLRIVSLLPSATEIVCALGFAGDLVGRSHECDFPPEITSLPILTHSVIDSDRSSEKIDRQVKDLLERGLSLYRVDVEKLKELKPDFIVTQTQCEVCAVSEGELRAALENWVGAPIAVISLQAESLAGLWSDFHEVAQALGEKAKGVLLVRDLQARMSEVEHRVQESSFRPRVACIEWLDPLMAAGNWIPEMVAMAGGENLFGQAGRHSPWMEWEALDTADPEVIVLMPCGFDLARTERETSALLSRPGWGQLSAVKNGRVYLVDGNQYFNRPGPRLADSLEILAEILHPESFPPRNQGTAWKPLSH